MNKYKIFTLLFLFFALTYSCNKNVKPIIIEEHDPVIKVLEERDSIRIIPSDSNKVKKQKK